MSARKLKRRAWWWSWAEWRRANETQREYLASLEARGWGDGGRIERVEFTDGSSEIRIPCKDGGSRMVNVIQISPEDCQ